MIRICAWCGKVMDPGPQGAIKKTHGMCPDCAARTRKEMYAAVKTELRRKEKEEPK